MTWGRWSRPEVDSDEILRELPEGDPEAEIELGDDPVPDPAGGHRPSEPVPIIDDEIILHDPEGKSV